MPRRSNRGVLGHIRIDEEARRLLKEMSEAQGRSMTAIAEELIKAEAERWRKVNEVENTEFSDLVELEQVKRNIRVAYEEALALATGQAWEEQWAEAVDSAKKGWWDQQLWDTVIDARGIDPGISLEDVAAGFVAEAVEYLTYAAMLRHPALRQALAEQLQEMQGPDEDDPKDNHSGVITTTGSSTSIMWRELPDYSEDDEGDPWDDDDLDDGDDYRPGDDDDLWVLELPRA